MKTIRNSGAIGLRLQGWAGIVAVLDVVLAPLWVWLAFAETPTPAALVGGGLTLCALLYYLGSQLQRGHSRAG